MTSHEASTDSPESRYARNVVESGIPPRPKVLELLDEELRQSEPDFRRIAQYVSSDVGLAGGLIKTANSPYFGYRQRARTVLQALNLLGMKVAGKALAGVALRTAFPLSPSMERFWDSSARTAEYSGLLVNRLGIRHGVRADDAYTYGLFRDCGLPVLLRKFANYKEILIKANAEPQRRFTDVEEEQLPTNHCIVGCMLAQSWSLPEEICLAIRQHHDFFMLRNDIAALPAASRRLIALTQLSEYIHQQQSGLSQTQEWLKLGDACLAALQITPEELPQLQQEIVHLSQHG